MTHVRRRHLWKVAATIKRQEGVSSQQSSALTSAELSRSKSKLFGVNPPYQSNSLSPPNDSLKSSALIHSVSSQAPRHLEHFESKTDLDYSLPNTARYHRMKESELHSENSKEYLPRIGLSELDDYDPDWDTQVVKYQRHKTPTKMRKNNIMTNVGNVNLFKDSSSEKIHTDTLNQHNFRQALTRENEIPGALQKGRLSSLPVHALDLNDTSASLRHEYMDGVHLSVENNKYAANIVESTSMCPGSSSFEDSVQVCSGSGRVGTGGQRRPSSISSDRQAQTHFEGEDVETEEYTEGTEEEDRLSVHVSLHPRHQAPAGGSRAVAARLSYVNTSIDNINAHDSISFPLSPVAGTIESQENIVEGVALDYYEGDIMNDMCELETQD
mmetsp:Transcript_32269/g.44759  ORF Transcript_32269/g.44759 Transcript_32269/m.44759 type:complete len:384 (-) Transcript_32269:29-1180(-)|eukprot:CAMPEP_0196587370 /NCGR_PEP_ID=MMETSP1081-20130531/57250_1 /TAXON_ID=36882 /ORGANISM="Pyramimonas amylifera, Strain CCMP720" /LENGTH=383 /DNA_ID=CAMNT_0041909543 /DNA_START=51 /DNA_END=1202 /DNA_ORIENTATION=+